MRRLALLVALLLLVPVLSFAQVTASQANTTGDSRTWLFSFDSTALGSVTAATNSICIPCDGFEMAAVQVVGATNGIYDLVDSASFAIQLKGTAWPVQSNYELLSVALSDTIGGSADTITTHGIKTYQIGGIANLTVYASAAADCSTDADTTVVVHLTKPFAKTDN